jgi:hypothetical protein
MASAKRLLGQKSQDSCANVAEWNEYCWDQCLCQRMAGKCGAFETGVNQTRWAACFAVACVQGDKMETAVERMVVMDGGERVVIPSAKIELCLRMLMPEERASLFAYAAPQP